MKCSLKKFVLCALFVTSIINAYSQSTEPKPHTGLDLSSALALQTVPIYEGVDDLTAVYNTAKAFGALHKSLFDFPVDTLGEVIPDFHNTEKRYKNFLKVLKLDSHGRANYCSYEINRINKFKDLYSLINECIETGEVKLGVIHNDPKINNVLFDKNDNRIRAVIDLDTMMPGSYLYDYGDALRSLMTGEFEDISDDLH